MRLHRLDFVVRVGLRLPARSEHEWNVGTVNIGIEKANFVSQFVQRHREIHGDGGFAHASFAGTNGDDGVDAGDGLRCWWLLTGMMCMCAQREMPFRLDSLLII